METISSIDKKMCTGCGACFAICPNGAITLNEDNEGFVIPMIDKERCNNCGACKKSCSASNNVDKNMPQNVYAVQRTDAKKLHLSSSGGIGALIAETIIAKGGVVYGAALIDYRVKHIRVSNENDLYKLYGSKYVQSDFYNVFLSIREDLRLERDVCVFGTPCQLAGLKKFLIIEYSNLYCIDLICHGVPSPRLFENYLIWLQKRNKTNRILDYKFRDKSISGWDTAYSYKFKKKNNECFKGGVATRDPYYESFIYAETYRESCYRCQYAEKDRVGDITIGDYWGIQDWHIEFEKCYSSGVSAVLINTKKGIELFEMCKNEMIITPSSFNQVSSENGNLLKPAYRPAIRDKIYQKTLENGFSWMNVRMHLSKRYYIKYIKSFVPKEIKGKIKRYIKRSR